MNKCDNTTEAQIGYLKNTCSNDGLPKEPLIPADLLNQEVIKKIISRKYKEFNYLFESYTDAKQEAVICLIKATKSFRTNKKSNFNTYYTMMLRYHYLDILNSRKKEYEFKELINTQSPKLDKIVLTPYVDYDYGFLNGIYYLDEPQKQLLFMYFYEDKTYQEIGREFGVSKQRIEQKLKRILREIKTKSGKDLEYGQDKSS